MFANRPASGNAGVAFLSSDGAAGGGGDEALYRDNGTTWDLIGLIPATVAPTAADYLVGTAQADLSAEIVVGAAPGGELGGSWASPTVDGTHSGSAHHAELLQATQAAIEARTNENTYVPPDLMDKSPGVAKAWGNAPGVGGIQSPDHNMDSITKNSTGNYTHTWTTDFSDVDYSAVGQLRGDSGAALTITSQSYAVGTVNILTRSSGSLLDIAHSITAHGDQA